MFLRGVSPAIPRSHVVDAAGEVQCDASDSGDGYCDKDTDNYAECQYDGGDCCECDCTDDRDFPCGENGYVCLDVGSSCYGETQCSGYPNYISDGDCDEENNTEECQYDGGDCCECDCTDDEYTCGLNGYDCLDVGSSCHGG
ncbi:unnamed protein product [Ectocarpus fasciculatus]